MKRTIKIFGITFASIVLIGIILVLFFIFYNMKSINHVNFDKNKLQTQNSQLYVYANDNSPININSNIIKPIIKIDELPDYVPNAFISIEDKRFFNHKGLDYKRMTKAMYNNIKSRRIKEGASTISQQLIKNTHLSNEKTYSRKIQEMLLTKKLEKTFSKKDILETYLNVIYFGEGSYGIESASQTFFNKTAKNLNLEESALLAGIIKSPNTYSPIYNYEKAIYRRDIVLKQMLANNKITSSQYYEALHSDLKINAEVETDNTNLYVKATLKEAAKILNLSEKDVAISGLQITTYLDTNQQDILHNQITSKNMYHINTYGNIADGLGIIIDNNTGGVVAYSGQSKYNLVDFNRQPGSVIKPILVYAPALDNGIITPATMILDEEINFNGYSPKNVGGFNGYVSINESINKSLNVPAVKILDYIGIDKAKSFAKKAGIEFDKNDEGLAIALGGFTIGNNLKDITNSYIPFSNDGKFIKSSFIKEIKDKNNKLIYKNNELTKNIMGSDTAYLINNFLIDAVKDGTSKKLSSLPYQVAGKTGTVSVKNSNLNTDAYSVAYTSKHTMGVWLGNYSLEKEYNLDSINNGGTYATEIIKQFFLKIYDQKNTPPNFKTPNTVELKKIDNIALSENQKILLVDDNFPERYTKEVYFSKRFLPNEISNTFNNLEVSDFNIEYNKDSNNAKIIFTPKNYLKYEIIKEYNNKEETLCYFENNSDTIEYLDDKLNYNSKYSYYIKVTNRFIESYENTKPIVIYTKANKEDYQKLLNDKNKTIINNKTNNFENDNWFFNTIL